MESVNLEFFPKPEENENEKNIKKNEETPEPGNDIQHNKFKDGRCKKSCQHPDCVAKRANEQSIGPEVTQNNENPELNGFEVITEEQPGPFQEGPEPIQRKKKKISGAMFLMGLEMIFPVLLKYVVGFLEPKFKRLNKAGKEALKLPDWIEEELLPYADDFADELFGEMPSGWGFIVIYIGSKFMLAYELDDDLHFSPVKVKE